MLVYVFIMEPFYDFEKPIVVLEKKLQELRELAQNEKVDFSTEIQVLESKVNSLIDAIYGNLTPWQRVQLSRHPNRPYALDYIPLVFENFVELHGDRLFGDDPALITGFGKLGPHPVAVVAHQKGRNTKQKIERNFGMAKPEGYRKALRIMKLASQFQLPIITLIDTPGAYPGVEAEERGQCEAIARCIMEMFELECPIIACVIGEGGSGGALAIGIADRVLMQEYSTYSVISPESCASILWSDSSLNETAAKIMKMTPPEILKTKVIDAIVPEPKGCAHRDLQQSAKFLKDALLKELQLLLKFNLKQLLLNRFKKYRQIGNDTINTMASDLESPTKPTPEHS